MAMEHVSLLTLAFLYHDYEWIRFMSSFNIARSEKTKCKKPFGPFIFVHSAPAWRLCFSHTQRVICNICKQELLRLTVKLHLHAMMQYCTQYALYPHMVSRCLPSSYPTNQNGPMFYICDMLPFETMMSHPDDNRKAITQRDTDPVWLHSTLSLSGESV